MTDDESLAVAIREDVSLQSRSSRARMLNAAHGWMYHPSVDQTVQDPTWNDTVHYIFSAWRRGDWPWATSVGLVLILLPLRIIVSLVWERHKRDQQIATIRSVFGRWADGLEQPFWMLSTPTQLAQIERLGNALVGNHEMVLALLVALRVQFETIPVDDAVLQAVDRLAAQWQDKLPSARRRRYRQDRGIEAEVGVVLNRQP